MHDWRLIFKAHDAEDGPGGDFEARVFAKIHRKKRQRQVVLGLAAAGAAATVLILAVFQPFHPAVARGPLQAVDKTEVPVSEELFFSTSDSRTRYSLQPVVLGSRAETPPVPGNQI